LPELTGAADARCLEPGGLMPETLYIVAFTPLNLLGLFLGASISLLLNVWRSRLSVFDWLFAALLNVPTGIFVFSALFSSGPVNDITFASAIAIVFLGTGGLGIGWVLSLICLSIVRARRGRREAGVGAT
jgi:hypothetical protein